MRGQLAAIRAAVMDDDAWIGMLAPLLEAMDYGGLIHDSTGAVRYMNATGRRFCAQQIEGVDYAEFQRWSLDHCPITDNGPVHRAIATGRTVFEVLGMPSTVGEMWIAMVCLPTLGPDGQMWVIGYYHDVTAQVEAGLPVPDLASMTLS